MKYDLQRLGPFGFQDLAAALALKVLGAKVQPMGRGRDGGRDMLANGVLAWGGTHSAPGDVWDGVTVFQVKHKEALATTPQANAGWLWRQIRDELDTWASPDSDRGDVPHYLVFVTNVPLTPVSKTGGFDTINKNIRDFIEALSNEAAEDHLNGVQERRRARVTRHARRDRMKRLRAWRLWDGNQIDRLIDAHDDVRRAFDGFLTAGDVLKDLSALSTALTEPELGPALKEHARWALTQERDVYFDEAGGDTHGVPVEQVAIDLPVHAEGHESTTRVIRYVLDRGDHILKPSLAALGKPRHLVIAGAPGNGKTTVSKFLVHAYRGVLISEDVDLADQHRDTIRDTAEVVNRMRKRALSHRRWPFRVDLAEFAERKATDGEYTLLNWIADRLSRQVAAKDVKRWVLWKWLQAWPSFLVLDGLDEVTEPKVRKGLIADVEAFVNEAEAKDCDMLVVVTTRPTGYTDDMPAKVFERIDLADLSVQDAIAYGRLVTRVRIPNDESRREGVEKLLAKAAADDALVHLLRTPLQVLIMSIIAESSRDFSPNRFKLFWGYYTTIETREKTKTLGFAALLRDHSPQVLELHCRVGLLLQRRAEMSSGATAVLSAEDLQDIAWRVLADAEYEPSTTHANLLDQIVTAVTHRLVLLAPRGDNGFGFDVRSLQELMAAMALTTGTMDKVIPRLKSIAPSPHWRNTLLFAIGRYFAEPQTAAHEAVTNFVLTVDNNEPLRLSEIVPVGPELAWEIVDDAMAAAIPRWHKKFLAHGLTLLHKPTPHDPIAYTRVLIRAASADEVARGMIRDALRDALGSTSTARVTAERIQDAIRVISTDTETSIDVQGLATVKRDPAKALPSDPVAEWESFDDALTVLVSDPAQQRKVEDVLAVARKLRTGGSISAIEQSATHFLVDLHGETDIIEALQLALSYVIDSEPALYVIIRDTLMPDVWRKPVNLPMGDDETNLSDPPFPNRE